ncbi:MAG: methyltransferase [Chloroflexi bacterium]|nr:methyltransferase [Chloroflexota bacterium]
MRGQALRFRATWGLFSPREVDEGTSMLLDAVEVVPDADCFDLGCGYGPIGLTLARLAPQGETWMVDRDFVAIDYANANAALNGITNARALLSNGFAAVPAEQRFDLVLSNLPAKVGNELLTLLIADAYAHLNPGGRLYVVTISGMRRFIERTFEEVFGNYEKAKQGRQHTVSMAQRD